MEEGRGEDDEEEAYGEDLMDDESAVSEGIAVGGGGVVVRDMEEREAYEG